MKTSTRFLSVAALAIGTASTPAFADGDADSLSALSAQWWQWAFSIPTNINPLTDADGRHCMVGQRGPVWFLAGTWPGTGPTARTCTVPEGTALFFPILNSVWVNTPACDGSFTVAQLRAKAAFDIDGASGLSVLLDNRPVRSLRRIRSDVFATAFPQGDLFGSPPCLVAGQLYSPSVDDGYYVRLPGLSQGTHHLSIRGTNTSGFAVDVFYTLNVVKVATKERD